MKTDRVHDMSEAMDGNYTTKRRPQVFNILEPHEHQHVIPVEWEPLYKAQDLSAIGLPDHEYKAGWKVTKLRCACGSEIER